MNPTRKTDESFYRLFSASHTVSEHLTKREDSELRDKYDHNAFCYYSQPSEDEVRAALAYQKERGDTFLKLEGYEPLADAFELTADLGQPVSAYSHGMKQKLAIIAAWLHEPRLILMDEPFVGLAPKASHLLKGMLREVCNAGGALFFSTHVLEVAEKLCDKVAIIKNGRLIRAGNMDEVRGDESLESVFLELEDTSSC